MGARDSWWLQLPIFFGVVVVSFVAAMIFIQLQLASASRASLEIADESAPSIEHLTTARAEMRHMHASLREVVEEQEAGTRLATRVRDVEEARRGMDEAVADYLALASDPDRQTRGDLVRTKDALNRAVDRCLTRVQDHDGSAGAVLSGDVAADVDQLSAAITNAIAQEATRSHELALEIARQHQRSRVIAAVLAALCATIAIAAAASFRHTLRKHNELADEHRALLEDRASELEQFAGRVAHDILSPLNAVLIALKTGTSANATPSMRAECSQRGSSAVKRIDRLIRGLFAFAVAGAKPERGVRADVEAVFADLEPELRTAAQGAGIELAISADTHTSVACNPGVLTSVVSNLALNAIKYMGDAPKKSIGVRAFESRGGVRIEVRDTGPGLLPGLEARVFEPYVRGNGARAGGIGLGLATVKRIAVAHGGRVGVDSVPGVGCTFWVELPSAEAVAPGASSIEAA